MKLLCALLLLLVAVHEMNAAARWPWPFGDSKVANVEDRNVDETAVEKLLSDRNVLDYLKALDEAGDVQMSGPEFKDKQ